MDEEEVVADRIAVKKDVLEALAAGGAVAEADRAGLLVGPGAVHDQPVDDLRLDQVRRRLIHAEHVLAEITAIALVGDPLRPDNEIIARREDPQLLLFLNYVEEIALVGLGP